MSGVTGARERSGNFHFEKFYHSTENSCLGVELCGHVNKIGEATFEAGKVGGQLDGT